MVGKKTDQLDVAYIIIIVNHKSFIHQLVLQKKGRAFFFRKATKKWFSPDYLYLESNEVLFGYRLAN